MRKLVYYVAVTLDGYIAGPGGEYDFFPLGDEKQAADYAGWTNARYPETLPGFLRAAHGLTDAPNQRFDTVLMGLGSYRPGLDAGFPSPYAHLRQYVVSSTLAPDTDPAVTVVAADPLALVRELKREDGQDIWLCGGGLLAGALLPEIDELIIKSYPVVAGSGIPVFNGDFSPTLFEVTDRTSFDNHVTMTWFARR
ncbi:deaminase [Kitasatospora herbaricolor]|uniref:dihydrofolate reductase family protein n=1 Tax=Kitasatospora herbaricolor TaxID=68217 RepID=UPI00174C675B|nr:dihydrofolate reductase family protein [Kitasatospora herbaricolor]MDQ0306316.1 dihydrofolate reductase [Kitasatospora herbaricolor]GGV40306.1 deaminase [Kitasatospora herbaricolor]